MEINRASNKGSLRHSLSGCVMDELYPIVSDHLDKRSTAIGNMNPQLIVFVFHTLLSEFDGEDSLKFIHLERPFC